VKEGKVMSGNVVLAQAAVDAVKKWKYEPAAVKFTWVFKIRFQALMAGALLSN